MGLVAFCYDFLKKYECYKMLDKNTNIVIIMPSHANIIGCFYKNLQKYFPNSRVISFEDRFDYPHFGHKIYNAFRKIFFKDRNHKTKLYHLYIKKEYDMAKDQLGGRVDYVLVIRPDFYPLEILEKFKSVAQKKIVAYQWDGVGRFPDVIKIMQSAIFEDFFVFEPKDVEKYQQYDIKFTTNFYFDFKKLNKASVEDKARKTAYFIGVHQKTRYDEITSLAQQLKKLDINLDFLINYSKYDVSNLYNPYSIKTISQSISYEENLDHVAKADILVDICMKDVHTGLSFRVFEALYAEKKLITNNPAIKDYEFYHPNNIFIMQNDNLQGLENFLSLPFMPIDEKIVEKYGFYNWLKNILDIKPHQPILMPKLKIGE